MKPFAESYQEWLEDCRNPELTHVVQFSGGAGSFWAAHHVIEQVGPEKVILLFADTLIEDQDLYIFLGQTSMYLDAHLEVIREGRTPWQVFRDKKFIGNSRVDPCSRILKRELCKSWMEKNFPDPEKVLLYVGIDHTEFERMNNVNTVWFPYRVVAPLTMLPKPFDKEEGLNSLPSMGIIIPRLYKLGMPHNNCFHGDTRFYSSEGMTSFSELSHRGVQNVDVFTFDGSWKQAKLTQHGYQKASRIHLTRYNREHKITATNNHRWIVRVGRRGEKMVTTLDLKPGDKLITNHARLQTPLDFTLDGVAAGIIYGDGTRDAKTTSVVLCTPEKQSLDWVFPSWARISPVRAGLRVSLLPLVYKDHPSSRNLTNPELLGWLMGYMATDGKVSGEEASISSASMESVQEIEYACGRLGILYSPFRTEMREGFRDYETPLYTVPLCMSTLCPEFFIRQDQREAYCSKPKKIRTAEWIVTAVEPMRWPILAYCLSEPEGHSFTLEYGIYTAQCGGGCVKAGKGHFLKLLDALPDRYAEWERNEKELSEELFLRHGKRYTILKEQVKGEKRYISLEELRERAEEHRRDNEWGESLGGCGCALDASPEELAEMQLKRLRTVAKRWLNAHQ